MAAWSHVARPQIEPVPGQPARTSATGALETAFGVCTQAR
jgi:hypothetical protein